MEGDSSYYDHLDLEFEASKHQLETVRLLQDEEVKKLFLMEKRSCDVIKDWHLFDRWKAAYHHNNNANKKIENEKGYSSSPLTLASYAKKLVVVGVEAVEVPVPIDPFSSAPAASVWQQHQQKGGIRGGERGENNHHDHGGGMKASTSSVPLTELPYTQYVLYQFPRPLLDGFHASARVVEEKREGGENRRSSGTSAATKRITTSIEESILQVHQNREEKYMKERRGNKNDERRGEKNINGFNHPEEQFPPPLQRDNGSLLSEYQEVCIFETEYEATREQYELLLMIGEQEEQVKNRIHHDYSISSSFLKRSNDSSSQHRLKSQICFPQQQNHHFREFAQYKDVNTGVQHVNGATGDMFNTKEELEDHVVDSGGNGVPSYVDEKNSQRQEEVVEQQRRHHSNSSGGNHDKVDHHALVVQAHTPQQIYAKSSSLSRSNSRNSHPTTSPSRKQQNIVMMVSATSTTTNNRSAPILANRYRRDNNRNTNNSKIKKNSGQEGGEKPKNSTTTTSNNTTTSSGNTTTSNNSTNKKQSTTSPMTSCALGQKVISEAMEKLHEIAQQKKQPPKTQQEAKEKPDEGKKEEVEGKEDNDDETKMGSLQEEKREKVHGSERQNTPPSSKKHCRLLHSADGVELKNRKIDEGEDVGCLKLTASRPLDLQRLQTFCVCEEKKVLKKEKEGEVVKNEEKKVSVSSSSLHHDKEGKEEEKAGAITQLQNTFRRRKAEKIVAEKLQIGNGGMQKSPSSSSGENKKKEQEKGGKTDTNVDEEEDKVIFVSVRHRSAAKNAMTVRVQQPVDGEALSFAEFRVPSLQEVYPRLSSSSSAASTIFFPKNKKKDDKKNNNNIDDATTTTSKDENFIPFTEKLCHQIDHKIVELLSRESQLQIERDEAISAKNLYQHQSLQKEEELRQKVKILEAQMEKDKKGFETLKSEMKLERENEKKKSEAKIKEAQCRVSQLSSQLAESREAIVLREEYLNRNKKTYEKNMVELEKEKSQQEKKMEVLQSKQKDLYIQVDQLLDANSVMKNALHLSQQRADRSEMETEKYKIRFHESMAKHEEKKLQFNSLQSDYDSLLQHYQVDRERMEIEKSQHEKINLQANEKIRAMENQMIELEIKADIMSSTTQQQKSQSSPQQRGHPENSSHASHPSSSSSLTTKQKQNYNATLGSYAPRSEPPPKPTPQNTPRPSPARPE